MSRPDPMPSTDAAFKYLRMIGKEMKSVDEEIEERKKLLLEGFTHEECIKKQRGRRTFK